MLDDGQSEALNRVDTRNTGRRLEHPEALPGSPQTERGFETTPGNTPATTMDQNLTGGRDALYPRRLVHQPWALA